MASAAADRPTARQTEYLDFIRAFTDRWGQPPSFEEIGRHFGVSAPSVNNMVKTLEARGFLLRVPGQARTLRVVMPHVGPASPVLSVDDAQAVALRMAELLVERLVPALRGASREQLDVALDAVADALDAACVIAGATPRAREKARAALRRVAFTAQGFDSEVGGRPRARRVWSRARR